MGTFSVNLLFTNPQPNPLYHLHGRKLWWDHIYDLIPNRKYTWNKKTLQELLQCCSGHSLISVSQFSGIVNCVTESLNRSKYLSLCLCLWLCDEWVCDNVTKNNECNSVQLHFLTPSLKPLSNCTYHNLVFSHVVLCVIAPFFHQIIYLLWPSRPKLDQNKGEQQTVKS